MDIVFDNISSLLVFTILFLVVYAAILNIYFIHKNGFHIGVNCWFCNKNSKVLYSKRNSFECPFCFQYNGFNKDGGYNRVIDAQHNAILNNSNIVPRQKSRHSPPKSFNGLCQSCNRNQELKVIQLANYEALDKRNYDKEVEHFEEQLEKTYTLCNTCSKIVQNTVRKQNAWIFGNRIKNIKSPNNRFLSKSSKATRGPQGASKFYHRLSIIRLILLLLSLFNLGVLCGLDVFLPKNLLSEDLLPNNVILSNTFSYVYNMGVMNFGPESFMKYLPKTLKLQESYIFHISMLGMIIEMLFSLIEEKLMLFGKFNKLFSWLILGLVSSIHFKHDISLYFRTLEIFCSLYLTYVYSSTCVESKRKHSQKFRLKHLKRDFKNEDCLENEESDSDSLNNSKASYNTAANKNSPIAASSFSSLNRSFESVRSRNSAFNNTLNTAKKVELNKHFNELNIGAFGSNSFREYPSFVNPFLNQNSRPQSPTSIYNYGSAYNSPSSPVLNQSQHRIMFPAQTPRLSNVVNSSFSNNRHYLNQPRSISPMSVRTEPMFPQNQAQNLTGNLYNHGLNLLNEPSTSFLPTNNYYTDSFSPRDNSSVISQNITTPRSPAYNLRSASRSYISSASPASQQPLLNNSFRPLSPSSTLERPSRSLLSPSKLGSINSFHTDDSVPNSTLWSNLNDSHLHQKFVVNSLSNLQYNSALNGRLVRENGGNFKLNNSRSSSTSSGFISNGDFAKGLSKSLPNSRDNSPERTSLLSEPIYNIPN